MELIDALQRLSVTYHFEVEISKELNVIWRNATSSDCDDDLNTVIVWFRLLRQHNCYMASGNDTNGG